MTGPRTVALSPISISATAEADGYGKNDLDKGSISLRHVTAFRPPTAMTGPNVSKVGHGHDAIFAKAFIRLFSGDGLAL